MGNLRAKFAKMAPIPSSFSTSCAGIVLAQFEKKMREQIYHRRGREILFRGRETIVSKEKRYMNRERTPIATLKPHRNISARSEISVRAKLRRCFRAVRQNSQRPQGRLSLRGTIRDEAISGFGQRLLRCARNDACLFDGAVRVLS